MGNSGETARDDARFTSIGERLILPGMRHVLRRTATGTVEGAMVSSAVMSAGKALEEMCLIPLHDADGLDGNPFTRRLADLTQTGMLRALRPTSAHYLFALLHDPEDRTLLASLLGVPVGAVADRVLAAHADACEISRETQRTIADYWASGDPVRYTIGMWGVTTMAAFGVRYLQHQGAELLRECLDERLPDFGRRLEELVEGLVPERRVPRGRVRPA